MQWNAISFISASKAEKNITVEDKKKNEYSHFINTYANIYTYIICDEND